MIKIGIISDIHLGLETYISKFNFDETYHEMISNRTYEIITCLETATQFFEKEQIQYLLITGDVFNTNRPAQIYQLIFWKWISDLLKKLPDIKIFIIPGNHDAINSSKQTNVFSKFRFIKLQKNIEIIEHITFRVIDNLVFLFVPHINKNYYQYNKKSSKDLELDFARKFNNDIRNTIKQIRKSTRLPIVLVGHGLLQYISIGFEANLSNFYCHIYQHPEISYYIVGHVHNFQAKNNILVPGSLIYYDFAEEKEKKYINIVLYNKGQFKIKNIVSPARKLATLIVKYKNNSIEFPKLEDYKDKIIRLIIEVDNKTDRVIVKQMFNKIKEQLKEAYFIESIDIKVKDTINVKSKAGMTYKSLTDIALLNLWLKEKLSEEDFTTLQKDIIQTFVDIESQYLSKQND